MKELHKGSFSVSDHIRYKELVDKGEIYKECLVRGNKLISLKELSAGKWEYEAEIDTSNPRLDELATLLVDLYGIYYTLASVPKVTPIQAQKEMLQELDSIKSTLERVA
tara:strand:- start:1 stop:327 length:327 start_codon:yes stop_codon:yes gene_type:complete